MSGLSSAWKRPLIAGLTVLVGSIAISSLFDQWRENRLVERERARVGFYVGSYAASLEGAFNRHAGRLAALVAFVDAQPSIEALEAAFPSMAEGVIAAAPELKSVQLNRNGRVVGLVPSSESAHFSGYNVLEDEREGLRQGALRALRSDQLTITGPVELRQGGVGLILRHRVARERPGFPDMVSIVVDLPALLAIGDGTLLPKTVNTVVLDSENRPMRGSIADVAAPVRLPIKTGDGSWTLLAAPSEGWRATVQKDLLLTRVSSLLISILIATLSWGIAARQEHLSREVAVGSRELARVTDDLRRGGEERLELRERLLHAHKMEAVGTLAGGIAHDFNNLLTAIAGFARLSDQRAVSLLNALAGSPEDAELKALRQDLSEISKATDRASSLTSQLLTFSRRQSIAPARIDLNEVVGDLHRMLRRIIGERIEVVTSRTVEPVTVLADPGQISQSVLNLVMNARDAMPTGGTIRLSTSRVEVGDSGDREFPGLARGLWAVLSVEDNGRGMEPQVVERIWEPFFTTKQQGDGTGLGLSMVYGVVTEAGGQVRCDSTPGKGTRVTLAFPLLESAHDPVREAEASGGSGPGVILAVEDEAGIRRLVSEILRRHGFEVRLASDGVDALEQLESGLNPDLVLTDVVMPRMGGRELAKTMQERGYTYPVVFMSGYQEEKDDEMVSAYPHFEKPFTPDVLVGHVRSALAGEG